MTKVIHTIEAAEAGVAVLVGEFNGFYSVTIYDVDAGQYLPARVHIADKGAALAYAAELAAQM